MCVCVCIYIGGVTYTTPYIRIKGDIYRAIGLTVKLVNWRPLTLPLSATAPYMQNLLYMYFWRDSTTRRLQPFTECCCHVDVVELSRP